MTLCRIYSFLAILAGMLAAHPGYAADCNGNGIEDACDIGCGEPTGDCDFPGCGESIDCNSNGVPDECDESCQRGHHSFRPFPVGCSGRPGFLRSDAAMFHE